MAWFRSSDRKSREPEKHDAAEGDDDRAREREMLLQEIAAEARMTAFATGRDKLDARVLEALAEVQRAAFVRPQDAEFAYLNQPLPIGHGQTISQPFIVALMTDLLRPQPDHVVLEVGTGSGYQAAVLSRLVRMVYSVEVIPELAEQGAQRLAARGYHNVVVRCSDGALGWPEHAPFDGIIVTAAGKTVPPALIEQLAPGGRLVIPVGNAFGQDLLLVQKDSAGRTKTKNLLPVAFVPLTGGR